MKTLMFGECATERTYQLRDPNFSSETEFEFAVAQAITCAYKNYRCIVFTGGFALEERTYRSDLALVANDFSHWFVIEVELITHSLRLHVLPQVRAFRYGEPLDYCATILARGLGIAESKALTLLNHVPRSIAVIANKMDVEWDLALRALDVQLLAVSIYDSPQGTTAFEIEGELEIAKENIGFGEYSVTDRSIRFHRDTRIPLGRVQISDSGGAPSWWIVANSLDALWVTKETGGLDVEHGRFIQIIRTVEGRLSFRRLR